jgi:hypothetical protein
VRSLSVGVGRSRRAVSRAHPRTRSREELVDIASFVIAFTAKKVKIIVANASFVVSLPVNSRR